MQLSLSNISGHAYAVHNEFFEAWSRASTELKIWLVVDVVATLWFLVWAWFFNPFYFLAAALTAGGAGFMVWMIVDLDRRWRSCFWCDGSGIDRPLRPVDTIADLLDLERSPEPCHVCGGTGIYDLRVEGRYRGAMPWQ